MGCNSVRAVGIVFDDKCKGFDINGTGFVGVVSF